MLCLPIRGRTQVDLVLAARTPFAPYRLLCEQVHPNNWQSEKALAQLALLGGSGCVSLVWGELQSFKSCPIHGTFGSSGKAHKRLGLIQQRTFCDSLNNEQPPRAVLGLQL